MYTFKYTFSPMMITTQKLTSLAFSFNDGFHPEECLSTNQKSQMIT